MRLVVLIGLWFYGEDLYDDYDDDNQYDDCYDDDTLLTDTSRYKIE